MGGRNGRGVEAAPGRGWAKGEARRGFGDSKPTFFALLSPLPKDRPLLQDPRSLQPWELAVVLQGGLVSQHF